MKPDMLRYVPILEKVKREWTEEAKAKIDKETELMAVSLAKSFERLVGSCRNENQLGMLISFMLGLAVVIRESDKSDKLVDHILRYAYLSEKMGARSWR
jgi:hypothetical protein